MGESFAEFFRKLSISEKSAIPFEVSPADSIYPAGTAVATNRGMFRIEHDLRIEKDSQGGGTTIRLIGHFQVEHIEELQEQLLRQKCSRFVLDLTELTFVDLDVIRFLGTCEACGTKVINCAPYIREWIDQERKV